MTGKCGLCWLIALGLVGCSDSTGEADSGETSDASSGDGATDSASSSSSSDPDSSVSSDGNGSSGSTDPGTASSSDGSTSTGEQPAGCESFESIVSRGSTGALGSAGFGIDLTDGLAFVAARAAGLVIVDIGAPEEPAVIGNLPTSDAMEVVVDGDVAVVADNNGGTLVVDVSDPTQPTLHDDNPSPSFGLRKVGDLVYVANRGAGLEVLDVSDPTSIASLGITPPAGTKGVDVVGDRAYVALEPGLAIFDLSDPGAPAELVMTWGCTFGMWPTPRPHSKSAG